MRGKRLDITGKRFGRLTAIRPVKYENSNLTYWLCKCDCGNEKEIALGSLRRGLTQSCGCFHRECFHKMVKEQKLYNEYEIVGNTVYVKMANSKTMICDLDDWERLKNICWSAGRLNYPIGRDVISGKNVKFHQQVMGKHEGLVIDHINRNPLDNRKCNLRIVTSKENAWNRSVGKNNKSGCIGVYKIKSRDKWGASITCNNNKIFLGVFDTVEEAIKARKEAETKYYQIHT